MSDSPEKKPPKAEVPRRPLPVIPLKPLAQPGKPAPRSLPAKPIPAPVPARPVTPPPAAMAPTPAKPAQSKSVVSDELAAALNKLAEEYAAPAVTNTPFITEMQRQEQLREEKRLARIRVMKFGAVALVAIIALHFTLTRVVYRTPSIEALTEHVQSLPDKLLPLYSTTRQPLQPVGAVYSETDRIGTNRIRYAAEVTLRLRKPLYVPASTNGTEAYRQLQAALQSARQRDLKHSLFPPGEGPEYPTLPLLLQQSHRAGEPIVIRMPFEARRFAWRWRLEPAQIPLRTANRTFTGDSIDRYQGAPHLIFGAAGSLVEVRNLMRKARVYVIAVAQQVQKRADVVAVDDKPAAGQLSPDAPAIDPNTPADVANKPALSLEELQRLFDPNAAAVDFPAAADVPAADPNAPATDPNAPAAPATPKGKAAPDGKKLNLEGRKPGK